MKVFKFGGASVKNAEGVRNLYNIVRSQNEKLVIVVSAMGKVTNALEDVLNSFFNRKPDLDANIQTIVDYHEGIVSGLFSDRTDVDAKLELLYSELREITRHKPSLATITNMIVLYRLAKLSRLRLWRHLLSRKAKKRSLSTFVLRLKPTIITVKVMSIWNCRIN